MRVELGRRNEADSLAEHVGPKVMQVPVDLPQLPRLSLLLKIMINFMEESCLLVREGIAPPVGDSSALCSPTSSMGRLVGGV